jgi:hypothetical protein
LNFFICFVLSATVQAASACPVVLMYQTATSVFIITFIAVHPVDIDGICEHVSSSLLYYGKYYLWCHYSYFCGDRIPFLPKKLHLLMNGYTMVVLMS